MGAVFKTGIKLDTSYALCKSMGDGWHLNTRLTWMTVALWCTKHNCQPAITTDNNATGNMDATHSHNGLESGIWDIVGCAYEWNTGIRLIQGELQVISGDGVTFDNSAIVLESSADSSNWYCINGLTGELMTPDGNGTTANSLKINNGQWNTDTAAEYRNIIDGIEVSSNICEKAKNMLIALGMLLPTGIATDGDYSYLYMKSNSILYAGGHYHSGTSSGVFCSGFENRNASVDYHFGFRVAFCEL